MVRTADEPSVYRYLDFRRWLEDWFAWRRARSSRYSYRRFAQLSGLAVGTLHNILAGRRSPSRATIARIAQAASLPQEEEEFLADLVLLTDSTGMAERNRALERVLMHPEVQQVRQLEGNYVQYLSNWHHVAIRELAQLPGFSSDPSWIAGQLGHGVTEAEAASALDTLLSLGLLERGSDGALRVAEIRVATLPQVRGLAFMRHHEEMMALSTRALQTVPSRERHYGAVTLTIPSARFAELENELIAFFQAAMGRFDDPLVEVDAVYQLNVQLFPLTRPKQPPDEPLPVDEE